MASFRRIGPWRLLVQWALAILFPLLPWLTMDGHGVLRIDLAGQRLFLFGQVLRIEELYLVLLAILLFSLGFLLVTVILGRVWCGWLCPQTLFSDLAEWLARRLGLRVDSGRVSGPVANRLLLQLLLLAIALLAASALLWYFIPPRLFFSRLASFDLPRPAWITLAVVTLLLYLDMALVRRLLCREFCPYGRIQTALVSPVTLTLHLPPGEKVHCIDCRVCVRVCPMGIDIRQGLQVECIACARCLDGCRQVMAGRGRPGLIRYSFGLQGRGARALLDPRVLLPAAALAVLAGVLLFLLAGRPQASLKVALSHTAVQRRLNHGRVATFFNAWIKNRSGRETTYTLRAVDAATGRPLPLRGQVRARLAPGQNRRLDFLLITPADRSQAIRFLLQDSTGHGLATAEARVDPPTAAGP